MVNIIRTRIGQFKGARIRLEPGEILTAADLQYLDNDIVNLIIDAGTYDPVTGNIVSGDQPVDISILSELTIPIVRLTIGGQFIYTMPNLSGWSALRSLTIMNTLIEDLDPSVYELDLTHLILQNNVRMRDLSPELNYMSTLQTLELSSLPLENMDWLSDDNTLSSLRTLALVGMELMEIFPDITAIPSIESLYIERSAFVLTDQDVDELLNNTNLSYLSLSPDQIDFDLDYLEIDGGVTVNVVLDDMF